MERKVREQAQKKNIEKKYKRTKIKINKKEEHEGKKLTKWRKK